jgi:tetratricopeptide (TPR) repeat protein
MVAMAQGRCEEAVLSFEEGLELCRPLGRVWLAATSHLNLATALLHAGDISRAENLFAEALALYREFGDHRFVVRTGMHIAQAAMLRGDHDAARARGIGVVGGAADLGDEPHIADVLETLSAVEAHARPLEAAFVGGAAAALRETMSARSMPFDKALVQRYLAEARSRVGEGRWQAAWSEGRGTSLDQVIERALRG